MAPIFRMPWRDSGFLLDRRERREYQRAVPKRTGRKTAARQEAQTTGINPGRQPVPFRSSFLPGEFARRRILFGSLYLPFISS